MTSRLSCARRTGAVLLMILCLGLAVEVNAVDFVRGDANLDGFVDLADAATIVSAIVGVYEPLCPDALDTNDDGEISVQDLMILYFYLFGIGSPPEFPFPDCGEDPTEDDLGCDLSTCAP